MVDTSYVRRLRSRTGDPLSRRNDQLDDRVASLVHGLGGDIVSEIDALSEPRIRDNAITLLAGTLGGFLIEKPGTVVTGVPGTIIGKVWDITAPGITRINNLHFQVLTGSSSILLTIAANSRVIFTNCTFEVGVTLTNMVTIINGGKASFNGCSFVGTQTTGNPINNAGAALDVYIVGCINTTTRPHLNATIIAELT